MKKTENTEKTTEQLRSTAVDTLAILVEIEKEGKLKNKYNRKV